MPHFKIVSRWDASHVLYEGEAETLKGLVGTAVKARANLAGADLADANLADANLAGANLADANLAGANLAYTNLAYAELAYADLADANLSYANLAGADLAGADLAGADLAGAKLAGADLAGAKLADNSGNKLILIGQRPCLQIGPIGSRSDAMLAFLTDRGVYVCAGCWFGTLAEFVKRLHDVYPEKDSVHGQEYRAACAMVRVHAKIWTPKKEG